MTFDAPPELVLLVPPWWLLALVAYATVWLAVACGPAAGEEEMLSPENEVYDSSYLKRHPPMTDAELVEYAGFVAAFDEKKDSPVWAGVRRLLPEVFRLRNGDLTVEEVQNLCHNLDRSRPGCSRAEFEAGCRAYQDRLFGKKS